MFFLKKGGNLMNYMISGLKGNNLLGYYIEFCGKGVQSPCLEYRGLVLPTLLFQQWQIRSYQKKLFAE